MYARVGVINSAPKNETFRNVLLKNARFYQWFLLFVLKELEKICGKFAFLKRNALFCIVKKSAEMAISLLILLPVAASLFWFLIHLLMAQRNSTFGIFLVLLAAAVGTFFTYACYDSPTVSWQLFGFSCLLSMFVSPCLIPLTWMYLRRMNPSDTYQNPMQLMWIIAPVALFTGAFLTYLIAGPEKMQIFLEYLYTEGHRKAHELYYGSVEWHFHRCPLSLSL